MKICPEVERLDGRMCRPQKRPRRGRGGWWGQVQLLWDEEGRSEMGEQVEGWLVFLSKESSQLCQACERHGRSFREHSVVQVDETQDSRILRAFQRGGHS